MENAALLSYRLWTVSRPLCLTTRIWSLLRERAKYASRKKRRKQIVHIHEERIGFRTIEFRPKDGIYVNGTKIIVKGTNRHSFHPDGGRTTNRELSLQDDLLIKEMNMNAVRSHYPPDKHFLEICDSLGIFYLNELAGWQNSYDTETGLKLLSEMINRDVNHPCIFMWSNGNE